MCNVINNYNAFA